MKRPHDRLTQVLAAYPKLTVAVSGGVDSLTLAIVAGRQINALTVAHAVSPAVPPEATDRVQETARTEGWDLRILNAQEFQDPEYLKNPVNRCYFCKSNLYARILEQTEGLVAAGTNMDDLGDFRPGLTAAKEKNVVHPFVQAEISKADIRQIASDLGLPDIANLPAQPCLASRIETGINISTEDLSFVHRAETLAGAHLSAGDIRCRITHAGVRMEFDQAAPEELRSALKALCLSENRVFLGVTPYKRGSAFLR